MNIEPFVCSATLNGSSTLRVVVILSGLQVRRAGHLLCHPHPARAY